MHALEFGSLWRPSKRKPQSRWGDIPSAPAALALAISSLPSASMAAPGLDVSSTQQNHVRPALAGHGVFRVLRPTFAFCSAPPRDCGVVARDLWGGLACFWQSFLVLAGWSLWSLHLRPGTWRMSLSTWGGHFDLPWSLQASLCRASSTLRGCCP